MSSKRLLITTASLAFILPFAAMAQIATPTATAPVSGANAPVTHAELPELVKQAILDNPDIIMQAVKKMHEKQVEDSNKEVKASLEKRKSELFNDTTSPSVGPKNADVTVIEFFDYHCGYCKRMLPAITQLLKEDKKVRVVFREFPILSADSVTASRAALAVNRVDSDKYFEFHTALMKYSGKFDEKSLGEIAKKMGVDAKKFKKEFESEEVTALLDKNRAIAEDLGIRGTPALIVGSEVLPGAIPYEDLQKVIENERNGGKAKLDVKAKATAEPAPKRGE